MLGKIFLYLGIVIIEFLLNKYNLADRNFLCLKGFNITSEPIYDQHE